MLYTYLKSLSQLDVPIRLWATLLRTSLALGARYRAKKRNPLAKLGERRLGRGLGRAKRGRADWRGVNK